MKSSCFGLFRERRPNGDRNFSLWVFKHFGRGERPYEMSESGVRGQRVVDKQEPVTYLPCSQFSDVLWRVKCWCLCIGRCP